MYLSRALVAAAIALRSVDGSALEDLNLRDISPAECSKVAAIVTVLKINEATPFCSSFLSIKPATSTSVVKVTSTTTVTRTSTITSGTASTSVVFKPGNPPARIRRDSQPNKPKDHLGRAAAIVAERESAPTIPAYVTAYATTVISSACSCLSIPTPTTTVVKTSTITKSTTTTVSRTVTPRAVTSTEYPCATPIPSLIPTIPYGVSNGVGVIESTQTLFGSGTSGTTLEGCCNLCFFDLPNCNQAYFFFYEGCVVNQATTVNGTGVGVSATCPNGHIQGLTYNPDTAPPFRSTGSIAGPCGQTYSDL